MNMKTLLLYAAITCGTIGTGAVVLPNLFSQSDVTKAAQEMEEGNAQHKGPPPIRTAPQGF